MMKYFSRHALLTTALSGGALGIGFLFPFLWPLSVLGVIGLWWFIEQKPSLREVVLGGLIAFTVKSLLAISWFWSAYPLDWVQFDLGTYEPLVIGYYWFTGSLFLGVGGMVLLVGWRYISDFRQWWIMFVAALWWVIAEVGSAWFFSLFTTAEHVATNTVFSFGYLGYLISFHPWLISFASLGGVYALSFIGCLFGMVLYRYFDTKHYLAQNIFVKYGAIVVMVTVSILSFIEPRNSSVAIGGHATTIAIVDTWFGNDATNPVSPQDRTKVLTEAIAAARLISPEYILLPEDSRYIAAAVDSALSYATYSFLSGGNRAVLLDSGVTKTADTYRALRAYVHDPLDKKVHTVDKQFLVPQGEFVPYFYRVSLHLFGLGELSSALQNNFNFRPGPLATQDMLPPHIPAVLFCFESADPLGVYRITRNRIVPFVAHPISHAWFHESKTLWRQADQMLKIQAIFNQVDIVSAGNQVAGAWYTKQGTKISPTEIAVGDGWRVSVVQIPK